MTEIFDFKLLNTGLISETVKEYMGDQVEGVTPRWTLFTNLVNSAKERQVASIVTVID